MKNWRGIDLSFQNLHEFDEFWPGYLKVSKLCTLMDSFWPKCIMFELKKYRGVMFDGTEEWCKIWMKTKLCFQKWGIWQIIKDWKNSDIILESKMGELNQNKTSKQPN